MESLDKLWQFKPRTVILFLIAYTSALVSFSAAGGVVMFKFNELHGQFAEHQATTLAAVSAVADDLSDHVAWAHEADADQTRRLNTIRDRHDDRLQAAEKDIDELEKNH